MIGLTKKLLILFSTNSTTNLAKLHNNSVVKQQVEKAKEISFNRTVIELAILKKHGLPSISTTLFNQTFINKYIGYNEALTNGGYDFQQFPLIKLLHIGSKLLTQPIEGKYKIWNKFENILKVRMHRCSIEEQLKLLNIMLAVWPKYRFNIEFITSVCLGLKKDIPLMKQQELELLFYITGCHSEGFKGTILGQIQAGVLKLVSKKIQEKQQKSKDRKAHLSLAFCCRWLCLGSAFFTKNDVLKLSFSQSVIDVIQQTNNRLKQSQLNEWTLKIPSVEEIVGSIYLASQVHQLRTYYYGNMKMMNTNIHLKQGDVNLHNELSNLKNNLIVQCSKRISYLLKEDNRLSLSFMLSLSLFKDYPILEQLIQIQVKQTEKYPKTLKRALQLLNFTDNRSEFVIMKLKLLVSLYQHKIIQFTQVKQIYDGLDFSLADHNNLELIHNLLTIQLLIYSNKSLFVPRDNVKEIIITFILNQNQLWRQYEWLAFHFLTLLTQKNQVVSLLLPTQETLDQPRQTKAMRKIYNLLNLWNCKEIIQVEKKGIQAQGKIKELQKFFIQIRVHQMDYLKPILFPFQRLYHFSNEKSKMAVNIIDQITPKAEMQKKLLGRMGWKLINIQSSYFLRLTLNQRLEYLSKAMKDEQYLPSEKRVNYRIQ